METSKINEQSFEDLIEKALVGSTREERGKYADVDDQHPGEDQFYWGLPKDMDNKLAIDTRRLWSFLEATQADVLAKYKGGDIRVDLPTRIKNKINQFGVLEVLRHPVDLLNINVDLFYPKPSASDSKEAHWQYSQNQFSVTRQLTFSERRPGLEIDMAIFVNGIPLFTIELKNPWTYQTAKYDGEMQYRKDRDPRETLLNFGRCFAHFTMDKDEVYFTTKLEKEKTYFMPFNKGLPDGQGAGNPVNPNGYKTSYMWEHIFQKDTISDIISNYSLFDYGKPKKDAYGRTKQVPHTLKNAKRLIFPRFHQLDVVTKLVEDVEENGVGKTYLIEHSAGSGKSNSLTWLAYKLIDVCPKAMTARRAKALDEKLFDTIIVVTDRRLLDNQISVNIKAFNKSPKVVKHAGTSKELKNAIEDNKRIVITTIQKFPYICDAISDVSDHNFAIIIDEAHSSQSGLAADKMNAAVDKNNGEEEGGEDTEDLIMKLIRERKMSENCSYFAFTATPKRETLERFGTLHADGHYYPYHLYSMKQAIEEGFILDVLTNYTTYHSYYEVEKSIKDNPKYNNKRAQKMLRGMVEREPHTIAEKAEIMLNHFDTKVYRSHKLNGQGKAIVATKDIECAIRYYQALQILRGKYNLPYNILIAFSGKKVVDGVEYTEESINGFKDSFTSDEFDKEENRILVVAKKYLTGFDQDKLCAMYIDKPLDGVIAVQALSRLNRAAPALGKRSEDLFVLDFYNSAESMKEAFDPYYTVTSLSGPTDVNILHDLRSTLLDAGVFEEEDIDDFAELFFHKENAETFAPILGKCALRFTNELNWDDDSKADFKMKCKQFVRVYSRMAAIMDFESADWEKTYWFLRLLIPELKMDRKDEDLKDLVKSVDLSTYGLTRTALNQKIELDAETTVVDPTKAAMVNANNDDTKDPLDQILKEFNERFFKGWKATPDELKEKLVNIAKQVHDDADYKDLVVGNADKAMADEKQNEIIDKIIRRNKRSDMSFHKEYVQDKDFKISIYSIIGQILENSNWLFQNGQPLKIGYKLPPNNADNGMAADSRTR